MSVERRWQEASRGEKRLDHFATSCKLQAKIVEALIDWPNKLLPVAKCAQHRGPSARHGVFEKAAPDSNCWLASIVTKPAAMEIAGANYPKLFGSLGSPSGEAENSLDHSSGNNCRIAVLVLSKTSALKTPAT